jgi:phosphoadenosine phosphosulfate reductase
MSLKEETLFGLVDKVAMALERIRHFEKQALAMNPDGYFVAFSGGKDSIVVLDLIRRAGVKHTAHFHMTTVDAPEVLDFIRKNYQGVEWMRPKLSMFQLILKKMMPPTRIVRFCCEHLKEGGGVGRMVVTGIRWEESGKRSRRRMVESCLKGGNRVYLHPIIEWSEKDVWQYIRENGLPYPSLYDEGFKRIGCIGCPMAGTGRAAEFKRWPKFEAMYRRAFAAAAAANRIKLGNKYGVDGDKRVRWSDGDAMFDWWMTEHRADEGEGTGSLFE